MSPDTRMLLLQLRGALAGLHAELDGQARAVLDDADVVVNELLLRTNESFYIDYYREGRMLAERGTALTGEQMDVIQRWPQSFDTSAHPALVSAATTDMAVVLAGVVHKLGPAARGAERVFMHEAAAWQTRLYTYRMSEARKPDNSISVDAMFTPERIEAYLQKTLPNSADLSINNLKRLPGGFSKTTILIDCNDGVNGRRDFVIRVEPPVSTIDLDTQSLELEYPILELAFTSGLPVPEPILLERNPQALGRSFAISRRVDGENYGSVSGITKALSPTLVRGIAELLARISRMPLSDDNPAVARTCLARWVADGSTQTSTRALVEYWYERGCNRGIDPSPIVTMAYDWLIANTPEVTTPPSLVHGDFGLHNLMVRDDRITSLLDWEACYAGDPAGDLSNLFFATEGKLDRDCLLDWYHEAGGTPVTPARLAYFDVFNAFKMTVGSLAPLKLIDSDTRAPISFAVLGLRYLEFVAGRLTDLINRAEQLKAGPTEVENQPAASRYASQILQ